MDFPTSDSRKIWTVDVSVSVKKGKQHSFVMLSSSFYCIGKFKIRSEFSSSVVHWIALNIEVYLRAESSQM